jgi:tRNA dimethylallyltransferase
VCGGTGMYLKALIQGLFDAAARDEQLRTRIDRITDRGGLPRLHRMIRRIDPSTRIAAGDRQRIQRALEVYFRTGEPISRLQTQESSAPRYRARTFVLTVAREELYRRIDSRVEQMVAAGLLDEVRAYLAAGLSRSNPAIGALGYAEMIQHLEGSLPLDEAIDIMKRKTRNYAKRQLTWFRAMRGPEFIATDAMTTREVAEQIKKTLVLESR